MDDQSFAEALDEAIKAGFEAPDVKTGIDSSGIPLSIYEEAIKAEESEIRRIVGSELEEVDSIQQRLESAKESKRNLKMTAPLEPIEVFEPIFGFMFFLLGSAIVISAGVILFRFFSGAWPEWPGKVWEYLIVDLGFGTLGIVLLALCSGLAALWWYLRNRLQRWRAQNLGELERLELEIDNHTKGREQAQSDLKAALEASAYSKLRTLIGKYGEDSYSTTLGDLKAPGLSEVYDPHYKVNTVAMRKLSSRLENMPGGSIGIAGPRGSGKTTLIASFCDAGSWPLKNRPVLSIMMSAPVDYNAREFVLHVFSRLCSRVLELRHAGGETLDGIFAAREPWGERVLQALTRLIGRRRKTIIALGSVLLASGLALGVVQFVSQTKEETQVATTSDATPKEKGRLELLEVAVGLPQAIGAQPPTLVLLGLLLQVLPRISNWFTTLEPQAHGRDRRSLGDALSGDKPEETGKADAFVEAARKNDLAIKFQQTFTSGWSGGIKVAPLGLEGGMSRSVSLAQRPLSLPEIVSRYRSFAKLLTQEYELLIGIDELDKMESDDKARRFLNDIKVLFGIEHCYYLLSISQSAMSSFERRGLPFRDEFDSTFDEVLRVEYLDFKGATDLIKRRVVGMPVPFVALGYCLSGGLPRDMIRSCRELVMERRNEENDLHIDRSCALSLTVEVQSKLRAIEISLQELRVEEEAAAFLEILREIGELEVDDLTSDALFELGKKVIEQEFSTNVDSDQEARQDKLKLRRLHEELASYLLFCSTVRGLFNEGLGESNARKMVENQTPNRLADARQSLAVNLKHSRTILDRVRTQEGLQPSSFE